MDHWLTKVVALLEAETSDLRELAKIAGANPRSFYRGVNFDGLNLSSQEFIELGLAERREDDTPREDQKDQTKASALPPFSKLLKEDWSEFRQLTFHDVYLIQAEEALHEGSQLRSRKAYTEEISLYLAALDRHPNNDRLWREFARALYFIGEFTRAKRILYALIDTFPQNHKARSQLVEILDDSGEIEEAIRLLKNTPRKQASQIKLSLELKLVQLLSRKNFDEAMALLNSLLAEHPYDSRVWAQYARLYSQTGDFQNAIRVFWTAIEKGHFSSALVQETIESLQANDRTSEIEHMLQSTIQAFPIERDTYKFLAQHYKDLGKFDAALEVYQRMADLFPSAASWKYVGDTLRDLGNRNAALEAYREAMSIRTNDPGPWKWIGNVHELNGDVDLALDTYEQAIKIIDTPIPGKWLSDLLLAEGRAEEAVRFLEHLRDRYADDLSVWKWLYLAMNVANNPEAEALKKRGSELFLISPTVFERQRKRLPKFESVENASKARLM